MNFPLALLALLASLSQINAPANAYVRSGTSAGSLPSAPALADAEATLAPLAFVQFCMSHRSQCDEAPSANVIGVDDLSWRDLQDANSLVNGRIRADQNKGSYDWSLEARTGNCNDYAVQKRDELIRRGYPKAALSLAAAITPSGEGHLVLTVRTDRGDFVLDNLRPGIVAWNKTGYRWLKRQSAENPRYWVALNGAGTQPKIASSQASQPREPDYFLGFQQPTRRFGWPMMVEARDSENIVGHSFASYEPSPVQLASTNGTPLELPVSWRAVAIVRLAADTSVDIKRPASDDRRRSADPVRLAAIDNHDSQVFGPM